jgi:hypothetical protein
MGLVQKDNVFTAGNTILAVEHNENYDTLYNLVNGNIDNANISASANIVDTKLTQITTASKVNGSAITALASIPSGAGNLPSANMPDKVVLSATDSPTELTIATGAITVTQSFHTVDTESDDASDDLVTINGGTVGMVVVLIAAHTDRSVVVKDGTGNIQTAGDMTLNNTQDTITLIYNGSAWLELTRSDNGA